MSAGDINLGWETIKSLVAKFIQAGTGFAGMVIFTRLVDKSGFGGFYLLLSVVMILDRPIRGFASAVKKRWSEENAPRAEILGSVLLINSGLIAAGVLISAAFGEYLVSYTSLEGAPHLFVALLGTVGMFNMVQSALGAGGYPAKQIWNDTLRSILTLPLQVGLVLGGMGALGMGYGLVGATVLTIPTALYFVWRRPRSPSRTTLDSLWKYAKYSIPGSFVGKAYDRMDVLLLGFFIGTSSVANYEVALKLTVPAGFMAIAIGTALFPKISSDDSRGVDYTGDIENAISYVSILAIPIFFGALAIPRPLIVTAFEAQYADAVPYLIGLAFYQIFATQSTMYQQTLSGMDLPDVKLRIGVVTLATNVVLGVALVLVIGPLGIVIGTIVSEIVQYALSIVAVTRRVEGLHVFPRPLLMQVCAGAVMYVGVTFVERQLAVQSVFDLLAVVSLGAALYGITLLLISPKIRITARGVFRDATA